MSETLIFRNFPMSPSSNTMYSSFNGRLIKSKEARIYVDLCNRWALVNFATIQKAINLFKGKSIRVDTCFVFRKDRFFIKDGSIRKLDCTNHIKAAHDNLSQILTIDDSLFVSCLIEKKYTEGPRDFIEFSISAQEPLKY